MHSSMVSGQLDLNQLYIADNLVGWIIYINTKYLAERF